MSAIRNKINKMLIPVWADMFVIDEVTNCLPLAEAYGDDKREADLLIWYLNTLHGTGAVHMLSDVWRQLTKRQRDMLEKAYAIEEALR